MSSQPNDIDEIGNLISTGDFASLADLHLIPCAIYLQNTLMVAQSRRRLGTYLAQVYAAVGLTDDRRLDVDVVTEPSGGNTGKIVTAKLYSRNDPTKSENGTIRYYCVASRNGIRIAMMEAMPKAAAARPPDLTLLN